MPLYEYRCDRCGKTFEVIRRITERDEVECPECGKKASRQMTGFSVGGFGSGGSERGGYHRGGGCSGGG